MHDEMCRDAAVRFGVSDNSSSIRVSPTIGGINNWVYYVEIDLDPAAVEGKCGTGSQGTSTMKYIVRLYNNGANRLKVVYEHEILEKLIDVKKTFHTPHALKEEGTQKSYISLDNGVLASMFYIIPGHSPDGKLVYIREMGRAAGELMCHLNSIYVQHKDQIVNPSPPFYYDLWHVHHAVTKEFFFSFCESSELLLPYRTQIDYLVDGIHEMEKKIAKWHTLNLSLSFVHGDLVTDNYLCDDSGKVSGIIDFEFIGVDWIAMELATCISKFPEEENAMDYFRDFFEGFTQVCPELLDSVEISILPSLIMLRILSNCVYFVGRIISGESKPNCLLDRLNGYYKRSLWIEEHGHLIAECFLEQRKM